MLTTIETKARPGKAYYGGPLAGPVVKRLVDYIYNRGSGRSLQAAASGPRRYPQEVKGAILRKSAMWPNAFRPT